MARDVLTLCRRQGGKPQNVLVTVAGLIGAQCCRVLWNGSLWPATVIEGRGWGCGPAGQVSMTSYNGGLHSTYVEERISNLYDAKVVVHALRAVSRETGRNPETWVLYNH